VPASMMDFTWERNLSARAPSMSRWSKVMLRYAMERMAMASVPGRTTGRFWMAPTQRMPTCGWWMMGVPIRLPNTPGFVMVKVPS